MGKTRLFAVAVCAAAVMGMGASAALAGEVTGNGKPTPIGAAPDNDPHASSICSFSGQNDDPEEPGFEGQVQSWGQDVKKAVHAPDGSPPGGVPGQACRGN
jgi:hypothetical protein